MLRKTLVPGCLLLGWCRLMFANVNGLHGIIHELAIAASSFVIVLCAETKVTGRRHISGLGMALYVGVGFMASRQAGFDCWYHMFMVDKVVGLGQNFYISGLYRSPSINDSIYDCLLQVMVADREENMHAVFCVVGDFNSRQADWLASARTDSNGVAPLSFSTLSDCRQLVVGPTHGAGGVLDLFMSNVPELCQVSVRGPVGGSDHSFVAAVITTVEYAPDFCVAHWVYQKTRVN